MDTILRGCRSVEIYKKLNRIEEGTYGVVYRAMDTETGDIVALKKLKLEREREGFPITSLREIATLLRMRHPHIVNVREVVVGKELLNVFIVMDFVEHDLKSLMDTEMKEPFHISEIKTIVHQLLEAVNTLHRNWIIHRDLKTSNLLFNNKGEIKVADFGLAREFGSPLGSMTPLVVTLWYRAPELLLGQTQYSTAVDMWSVGCIFAELLLKKPLFRGKSEIDQLHQIIKILGTPTERIWPGYASLPNMKIITLPSQSYNYLRSNFPSLSEHGLDLLNRLFTYDPLKRISAEKALLHPWFQEHPLPKSPEMFPTWPSRASEERKRKPDYDFVFE